jgi:glucose-6-phosphate 1-dehydrogenase
MTAAFPVDALVVFGATGDLAKLQTFPALVGLVERGLLEVPVIGVAKAGWQLDQFRDYAADSLRHNGIDPDAEPSKRMLELLRYVDGDLADDTTYRTLAGKLPHGSRALFYMEVPPSLFATICKGIGGAGLAGDARVMVEKPFGTDLRSARQLNETMHEIFPEDSIYRVDHWLGLDATENVLFARFANTMLEPLLNRTYVGSIQITMAEAFGVSDRGHFYDRTGAIRDVVQNHILQVLAAVMMEPPVGGLDTMRDARASVIRSLRPLTPDTVVRGQYSGYREVDGVEPGSTTETFAALRLAADTWRWEGVPILIRAGKSMPVTATDVTVRFRRPPRNVFGIRPFRSQNSLRFRIEPEAAIGIELAGEKPGAGFQPQAEELVFKQPPGSDMRPYDRLIGAALNGERWLFAREDMVEAAWRVVDAVLGNVVPVRPYEPGTWGPVAANQLLSEGEQWYDPRP